MERPFMIAAGLTRGMRVVHLGCGDGTHTRFLAGEVSVQGSIIGVDETPSVFTAHALKTEGSVAEMSWHQAPLHTCEWMDSNSVDFVLVRNPLFPTNNLDKILLEILRILKPGGSVCIFTPHDGLLWIHPEPEGFSGFAEKMTDRLREHGVDRHKYGAPLPHLLRDAGFESVQQDIHVYDSGRLPAEIFIPLALEPPLLILPPEEVVAARLVLDRVVETLKANTAHASAGFYATRARKPHP